MADDPTGWEEIARHDVVMATVREFAEHTGAARVSVVLDRGDGRAAPLLECEPGTALTVTAGEQTFVVPPDALAGVPALPVAHPKAPPRTAIEVDAALGQVSAPIGVVPAIAAAVQELARVLGGRTVAVADFATRGEAPLTFAARVGEPIVLAVGEQQFELPG